MHWNQLGFLFRPHWPPYVAQHTVYFLFAAAKWNCLFCISSRHTFMITSHTDLHALLPLSPLHPPRLTPIPPSTRSHYLTSLLIGTAHPFPFFFSHPPLPPSFVWNCLICLHSAQAATRHCDTSYYFTCRLLLTKTTGLPAAAATVHLHVCVCVFMWNACVSKERLIVTRDFEWWFCFVRAWVYTRSWVCMLPCV